MATISKSLTRTSPRFFYGWLIVLIAFCGMFITAGTGGYIFGQFIGPLSRAFGWSVGLVSSATLVRSLTSIAIVPMVGRITDRVGSRPVMLVGALIGGSAFVLLAFIGEPIIFYVIFTVVVSIGYAMLGGIPSQAAVARWFRRRRGLALSLVTLGISIGGVVMIPLAQYALDNMGWRFTLGAIGVGILLVMLPPVFLFMRDYPEEMGLQPDGDLPSPDVASMSHPSPKLGEGTGVRALPAERTWSAQQILVSPNFWKQALGYMFAFAMLQVTLVHQFNFITHRGFDGATTAFVLSLYALSAGLSKFAWGYLADRYDVHKVAVVSIWMAALGMVVLIFSNDMPMLWVYALVGGWGIGGLPALQSIVTAESFGRLSYGTVAGLLNPMNMIASAVAVPFAGFMFDATGTYSLAFGIILALAMLSSLSLLTLPQSQS